VQSSEECHTSHQELIKQECSQNPLAALHGKREARAQNWLLAASMNFFQKQN